MITVFILYLVAAFSRRVLFRHSDRFAALLLDEGRAFLGRLLERFGEDALYAIRIRLRH